MPTKKMVGLACGRAYSGVASPLRGPVLDVMDYAYFMTHEYGFRKSDIRLCVDENTSKENMLDRLRWLFADAKPGDELFYCWSGHGVQFATRNVQGEPDGKYEAIAPFNFDWTPERMIIDKEIVELAKDLPEGVIFDAVHDACHTDDGLRDVMTLAPDGILTPRQIAFNQYDARPKTIEVPVDLAWRISAADEVGLKSRGLVRGMPWVGYYAASESWNTSLDIVMEGKPCGAFSHSFFKEMADPAARKAPKSEVIKQINRYMKECNFGHQGSAAGPRADRPFMVA